ncbi:MAG: hypothetical protein IEMM0002_0036 [bacterium]|nr:MAG: hypothetical protein IEMM0002_0036 [bacterium]
MTPGINPSSASFLKHILHISNLRRYPLGRPHNGHLLYPRVENLGLIFAFAINAALAKLNSLGQFLNGMPSAFSNALPSASVLADVTIVIFNPFVL